MAVTDITATVLRITGISPTANSIEDAQRFVASSIPKELLRWSSSFTTVEANGGGATDTSITIPTGTDSILDVSRNGFSATEVPYGMKGFIANTASLHKATNTYPKYYLDNAVEAKGVLVVVHPVPTDSATAVVLYVDFSKIGDDCDLRNAVIYHTSAQEFTKLGSDELPTISIDMVPPDSPTLSEIEYSPVGVVESDFPTSEPFTVTPIAAADILGTTKNFNDYFEDGDLNPLNNSDPGPFVMSAVPPDTPTVPDFNVSVTIPLPTYDSDFTNNGNLTELVPSTTADEDQTLFNKWFDVAGDYITDEDTELSTAQIQKITAYLEAYGKQMQNAKNVFDTELEKYKTELNNELGKAQYEQQAEHTAKLQQHQSEVAHYQAEVAAEVGAYTQKLQRYITELGMIQQSWTTEFQAGIQESMQELQVTNQRNIAAAQAELQLNIDNASRSQQRQLQNSINDMQALLQDNQSKISKYQADIATYQAESSNEVQEYQTKMQKQQAYSKEADKYYQWANAEIHVYIRNHSSMISKTIAAQSLAQQHSKRVP